MKRRYAKPTIPYEAWVNMKKKYDKLNLDYRALTNSKKRIPFTSFILSWSEKPVYYDFEEIKNLKRKKKKGGSFI